MRVQGCMPTDAQRVDQKPKLRFKEGVSIYLFQHPFEIENENVARNTTGMNRVSRVRFCSSFFPFPESSGIPRRLQKLF
jgi:hypothetical protein